MDQQSAFAIYNKTKRTRKSKPANSLKVKKTLAKKKHSEGNLNTELISLDNKRLKNMKKEHKIQIQSKDLKLEKNTKNNKSSNGIGSRQVNVAKAVKNKNKVTKAKTDSSMKKINPEDEVPPTLITIPESPKRGGDKTKIIDDNSIKTAKRLLHWIIQPTSVGDFFDNCWEKAPLYVKRTNKKYFAELFSSHDLDVMLRSNSLFFKTNVDIAKYKNGVRQDADTVGRAYPNLVWDLYNDGHTVRISDPQTYDLKLRRLLSTLQEYFGCFVGSNVYLTPPDSQGFAPHYDDIEAFIIQVEGRKHWKLYNPPTDEDVLARVSSGNYAPSAVVQPPIKEITLNAGDVLYFPRGTVHEGYTDADSHSLHITVSTYQKTAYADLLEVLCKQAMERAFKSSAQYRKGLPLHYLKHAGVVNTGKRTDTRKEFMKTVRSLFLGLWEHGDVDSAVDEMGRKFMHESLPPICSQDEMQHSCLLDGDHLLDGRVIDRAEMHPDTKVRLLRYHCIRLVVDKSTTEAKIYYNVVNKGYKDVDEQFLDIELSDTPIIESLQEAYPQYMSIESIPHKDLQAKLNLVQVLWQYGLIVTESTVDSFPFEDDDNDVQMTVEMVDSNAESESDSNEKVVPTPKKLKIKN